VVTRPEPFPLLISPEVVAVVAVVAVVEHEAKEALMNVAEVMAPLVATGLGASASVHLTCWDGSELGPPDAPLQLTITSPLALRRLLWAPNQLGFARAYVAGDILVGGDLLAALSMLEQVADPESGPGVVVDGSTRRAIVTAALRLGILGRPPRPPVEEARLGGLHYSKGRAAKAIAHHYDVGNEFYELVLGPTMAYSCAYFDQEPGPAFGLDQAQLAKVDLVSRKLGLRPGMRVLDVGCGWGTFVCNAARDYGVEAVGITLSQEQAEYARRRAIDLGLADRVEIRVQDYRDVDDGPFDAIASIGMAEHVGAAMLPTYSQNLFALLSPGGRLLNHAISRRPGPPERFSRTSFIDRYVFPDGELEPLAVMAGALEEAGFEVRDVESLREHYALTLRAWVANLEAGWDRAVELSTVGRARVWRLYMAGCALSFEGNRLGVNQVLAVRPAVRGVSGMPRTRASLFAPDGPASVVPEPAVLEPAVLEPAAEPAVVAPASAQVLEGFPS
jgi:cyclopropane-fatty-acyl-phospholipid synthase